MIIRMYDFNVECFMANPSLSAINLCRKEDLRQIATHLNLTFAKAILKRDLKLFVIDILVELGIPCCRLGQVSLKDPLWASLAATLVGMPPLVCQQTAGSVPRKVGCQRHCSSFDASAYSLDPATTL